MATNRKDQIDTAVLSRVPLDIYVGPPDWQTRNRILSGHVNDVFNTRRGLKGAPGIPTTALDLERMVELLAK